MRRKLLLVAFLVALVSGSCGYQLVARREQVNNITSYEKASTSETMRTIDNGLALRILGENQSPSYQLIFKDGFRQATIEITTDTLPSETYVRILDAAGNLILGEYTIIYDQANNNPENERFETSDIDEDSGKAEIKYYFSEAPRSYQLAVSPGMKIEIQAKKVEIASTLDGREIVEFAPRTDNETYIVTENGLRRADLAEVDLHEIMYQQLRRYASDEISAYQASIPEYVLYNRMLDTEEKARMLQLYEGLLPIDRESYADFVEILRRGGVPVITYRGAMEYERGSKVDFLSLIDIYDNEDGEIAKENLSVDGVVDFEKPGSYKLKYIAIDSDGNSAQLALEIIVKEKRVNVPEQIPNEERPITMPSENNSSNDIALEPVEGVELPKLGGGVGVGDENTDDVTTVWSAQEWRVDYQNEADGSTSDQSNTDNSSTEKAIQQTEAAMVDVGQATKNTEQLNIPEETMVKSGKVNVLLIILGGLAICGLLKFFFDHYVR